MAAIFKPVASTSKTILDITDSYTIVLTNESVSIIANPDGSSPAVPVSTEVIAYRGTTPLTPTDQVPGVGKFRIESISMNPLTGFTSTISNLNKVNVTGITTNTLNSGTVTIAINVEGKATINKVFSWSKALKGANGTIGSDAYTVILSSEAYTISCNADGSVKTGEIGPTGNAKTDITVYKGTTSLTKVAAGATPTTGQFKYVIGTPVNCTAVRTDDDTFYVNTVTTADTGSVPITVYCEGTTIAVTKVFTWNKAKDAGGLDWINEWNKAENQTIINSQKLITPKIFAGTNNAGNYTGIAIGKDIFGTGTDSGIAGYKDTVKTFHIKTDGSAVFGANAGRQFIINANGTVVSPTLVPSEYNYLKGLTINNGTKDTFVVDANGNVSINGVVTITSGSVPDAVLSTAIQNGAADGTIAKGVVSANDSNLINANPLFLDWTGANPAGYSSMAGSALTKTTSPNGTGNAVKYTITGGSGGGYLQPYQVTTKPFYNYITVETTIMLESGDLSGAGILVRYEATADVDHFIKFADMIPSPTLNKWYTVTKVIKQAVNPTGFTGYSIYPMGAWATFGTVTTKTIYFDSLKARPSTQQEINAYETGSIVDYWKATEGSTTVIDGGKIKTDSITAEKIVVGSGSVGGGNLAAGKAITGSSTSAGATDGLKTIGSAYVSFSSGNQSNNAAESAYIQIDLGSTYRIAESRAYFFSGDSRYYWYKIKYSTDGTNWSYAVGNSTDTGWAVSTLPNRIVNDVANPTINTFSIPITARYIRLYGNGNTVNASNHIYEWELFSTAQTVIDGSQITTGFMTADKIKGNTLTLGGSGDANGLLKIKDTSDTDIVTGDSSGLTINTGKYRTIDKFGVVCDVLAKPNLASDPNFTFDVSGTGYTAIHPYQDYWYFYNIATDTEYEGEAAPTGTIHENGGVFGNAVELNNTGGLMIYVWPNVMTGTPTPTNSITFSIHVKATNPLTASTFKLWITGEALENNSYPVENRVTKTFTWTDANWHRVSFTLKASDFPLGIGTDPKCKIVFGSGTSKNILMSSVQIVNNDLPCMVEDYNYEDNSPIRGYRIKGELNNISSIHLNNATFNWRPIQTLDLTDASMQWQVDEYYNTTTYDTRGISVNGTYYLKFTPSFQMDTNYRFGISRLDMAGDSDGIVFNSEVNSGSDYGYIKYYSDNNSYIFWGDSMENSALVIGVMNDGTTTASDVVVLKSSSAVIVDTPELMVGNNSTNPWITVNSRGDGDDYTQQSAGISVGEEGRGSAAIHMTYTGDGYGWIGMGTSANGKPGLPALKFHYQSADVTALGALTVNGALNAPTLSNIDTLNGKTGVNFDFNIGNNGYAFVFNNKTGSGKTIHINSYGDGTTGTNTEPAIIPSGDGFGSCGTSDFTWYRGYFVDMVEGSNREMKYDISSYDDEEAYNTIKDINIYRFRYKIYDPERDMYVYRGNLKLGAMAQELPIEIVDYDTDGGNGLGVNTYSVAFMAMSAAKHMQKIIETLEQRIIDLEGRMNGTI
jgi:hypothetical protein